MIRLTDADGTALINFLERKDTDPQLLVDLSKKLVEQLASPSYASDALETVSKILIDLGRNGLVGDNLLRLREALLTPSEMIKLRARAEPSCLSCHSTLHDGVMASYHADFGGFVCSRCLPTEAVRCEYCSAGIPIPARVIGRLHRTYCVCDGCKPAGIAPPEQTELHPIPPPAPRRNILERLTPLEPPAPQQTRQIVAQPIPLGADWRTWPTVDYTPLLPPDHFALHNDQIITRDQE